MISIDQSPPLSEKERKKRNQAIISALWDSPKDENEQWRDIPGYNGEYKISNKGRVMHCRILKHHNHTTGYIHFVIRNKCKKQHRLVAESWIEKVPGKDVVNHKNGIKNDNRIENLEWRTQNENMKHAYAMGLKPRMNGSSHPNSKLKESDVIDIINSSGPPTALAKKYNITATTVSNIRKGILWKSIIRKP